MLLSAIASKPDWLPTHNTRHFIFQTVASRNLLLIATPADFLPELSARYASRRLAVASGFMASSRSERSDEGSAFSFRRIRAGTALSHWLPLLLFAVIPERAAPGEGA